MTTSANTVKRKLVRREDSRIPEEFRSIFPSWATFCGKDQYGFFAGFKVNGIELTFRWIPPGSFLMGSPDTESGRCKNEGPQHKVTLTKGFWLGETPCTRAQYQAVMGMEIHVSYKAPKDRNLPITDVSWEDCFDFFKRLHDYAPGGFPTEAEWEYACRAGTISAFNDGSDCTVPGGSDPAVERLGWHNKGGGCRPYPVKRKRPNAWGLYDMHGNVCEWCGDWFAPYKETDNVVDPTGPEMGFDRVTRGGSWGCLARSCRSALRNWSIPGLREKYLGFRIAIG